MAAIGEGEAPISQGRLAGSGTVEPDDGPEGILQLGDLTLVADTQRASMVTGSRGAQCGAGGIEIFNRPVDDGSGASRVVGIVCRMEPELNPTRKVQPSQQNSSTVLTVAPVIVDHQRAALEGSSTNTMTARTPDSSMG